MGKDEKQKDEKQKDEKQKDEKKRTLTKQDIRMIKYFQQDKGDVTMWSVWKENKKLIKRDLREVWKAVKAARDAQMFLNLAIDRLDEEDYPDEENGTKAHADT
jgi:hypothetical protein